MTRGQRIFLVVVAVIGLAWGFSMPESVGSRTARYSNPVKVVVVAGSFVLVYRALFSGRTPK